MTPCLSPDLQYRFLVGRDSDTSSPYKPKSFPAGGSKTFGDRVSQAPPSDLRISPPDDELLGDRQLLQDVYPLAPQQWLVKKRGEKELEKERLVWNKGYPGMGIVEDTNEGEGKWAGGFEAT